MKSVTNYISSYVLQNKDIHTSLERHEGEYMMTEFSFLAELSF